MPSEHGNVWQFLPGDLLPRQLKEFFFLGVGVKFGFPGSVSVGLECCAIQESLLHFLSQGYWVVLDEFLLKCLGFKVSQLGRP